MCIDDLAYAPYMGSYTYELRGYDFAQGDTEAGKGNNGTGPPVWNVDASNYLHTLFDKLNNAGVNTSKCRVLIMRCHPNYVPARVYVEDVRAQQVDLAQNFLVSYHPEDSTRIRGMSWTNTDTFPIGDGVHFSTPTGLNMFGNAKAAYFIPFINE